MEQKAAQLGELLKRKNLTLAVAESCTGGLVGAAVTSVDGSSAYFRGGVIAYDNNIKRDILGVSSADLEKYGAVSDPVVKEMAYGVANFFNCDCGVSVSGVAGPHGGTKDKPVGLVFIGAFFRGRTYARSFLFIGNRREIRSQSVMAALDFLIGIIDTDE
ncbi:MAG: CinA family protein [Chitinispirillales bacterium]|jgi:PncC family amidohydrolase|nr:CinA family protein [Chitinispirillales bacterium]